MRSATWYWRAWWWCGYHLGLYKINWAWKRARLVERARFWVGLHLAYLLWRIAGAFTAVGNWAEDVATARHPLSLQTHWSQRGDSLNGWQR